MRPLCLALFLAATPAVLAAQQSTPPVATTPPLEIGVVAPQFTMNGATRYGVLARPVHLSDFKGKTVVLAFFFKARTSG
jgi:cytochrome oxidase Cu insertion factor (SCO1/SenC/PrrC family)